MVRSVTDNPRKHIIYVTPSFPFGPGESFIKPELLAWHDSGYTVSVIPIWPRGPLLNQLAVNSISYYNYPAFSVRYLIAVFNCFISNPVQFVKLLLVLATKPTKFIKNLIAFMKGCAMSRRIKSLVPAHIHAHFGGTSSTMAMVMSDMLGIPWSMTCHRWDIYEENLLAAKSQTTLFTRFISQSGMVDGINMGVDAAKSVYIPMGVSSVNATAGRRLGDHVPVVMCAANLVEVKGHRYLLEAVSELKNANFIVHLKIAGNGPLRAELEELAQHLDIAGQVDFMGHISQAELLSMYSDNVVDLFVLPSIDLGNGHHEGVPVSLMEAMSYGIPVISTKTGSIEELLDPSLALTVPGNNSSALARAMKDILSSPDTYQLRSEQVINCIKKGWLIQKSVECMKRYIERIQPSY